MKAAPKKTTLTELFAVPPAAPPKRCKFARLLLDMPAADAEVVEAVLAAGEKVWPSRAIAERLEDHGYTIPAITVTKHRIHNCGCKA